MIRYLEVPDFHFDVRWKDVNQTVVDKIIKTVKEQDVDFVLFPGDIYNRPIYATDQGGINVLRDMFRLLCSIVPVAAISGTPSHEAPGSLDILEDCGLVLLRPNNAYGLFSKEIKLIQGHDRALELRAVLFGIPEINKKKVQSVYKLSAKKANAKAVELFYKYVDEFVAPSRMKYDDIPAVCAFHGNVSDSHQSNETDIIKKSSDIVIHTEKLVHANIDRWSLGHIHKPWESTNICGGYAGFAGMDDRPWGNIGFKPGMNMVELEGVFPLITRIPYGTPERRKIIKPLQKYDPKIAYWLYSDDPKASLPADVHPWSRVTYNIEKAKSRRVTREQAKDVKALDGLFKLNDPQVSESILEKVKSIEINTNLLGLDRKQTIVESVEVSGCKLFKGKTVKLDFKNIDSTLNRINGDNGSGKSSLLSFVSPYPLIIGKDTLSGRASAIKDFFSGDDCYIKKNIFFNGKKHEHLITIKNPDKSAPKTECYLTIEGQPELEKGTFDEMMTRAEEIYGSFNDYLLTTFYVQPQQGKTQSGLMDANMTDIRNLVQSIAGINREQEKRAALNKVNLLDKEIKKDESWLEGVKEFSIDKESLTEEVLKLNQMIPLFDERISKADKNKDAAQSEHDIALQDWTISKEVQQQLQTDTAKAFNLQLEKTNKEKKLSEIEQTCKNLKANKETLAEDNEAIQHNNKINEVKNANKALELEYNQKVHVEQNRVEQLNQKNINDYNNKKRELETEIKLINSQIESLSEACPNCGHMPHLERVNELTFKFSDLKTELLSLKQPLSEYPAFIPMPNYSQITGELKPVLSTSERTSLLSEISKAEAAEQEISELRNEIINILNKIKELNSKEYKINPEAEDIYKLKKSTLNKAINELSEHKTNKASLISNIENTQKKISEGEAIETKIKSTAVKIEKNKSELEDWKYIDMMLLPSKIPALELELVVDMIDDEATRIIHPFLEGKYSFDTRTQLEGKKSTVDKFDILIHDNETGLDKSFIQHSPGEKAFFADAYTKALIKQRNERSNRFYDPVIMDESDGPIQPERIAAYYDIQKSYWQDNKVLIVSHSSSSHEYIENTINIEELKCDQQL